MTKIKRIPTQVYIGAFQGEETAREIEKMVTDKEFDAHQVICTNMALATRDIAGKTRIREMGNPQIMEAAVSQAMLGGLLGSMSRLMIGDSAEAKAARELTEAKPNKRRTSTLAKAAVKQVQGMDKDRLAALGKALKPGSSCIVLMFDEVLVTDSDYDDKMKDHRDETDAIASIVTQTIHDKLAEGSDLAFHILMEDGKITSHRLVTGEDAMQVRDIVVGQESFEVNQFEMDGKKITTDNLLVTPDAVTQARTLLTDSLVAYEISQDDQDGFAFESGFVHESDDRVVAAYEEAAVTKSFVGYKKEFKMIETETIEN